MLIDVAIPGDRNVIRQKLKDFKYKDLVIEIQLTSHVSKSDTSNYRGDCNHFKITPIIPEQHTMKARN
jgi:hypothetical protein